MSAITVETLTIFSIVLQENRATEWRESGISIDLIARLLGHKKLTLRNKDMSNTDPNYSIKSRIKWMFTE